ncbi:uncharacterized protein TRAVEDRAFT_135946 [Trametes versicolor FP-101664 SS1]|uniref:uncharacterized protein n=1 Tax=Trametes versicolor (strain FP-101664) TaxID=717944 RepID=UPI0004623D6C|nr:uncharacterized protein TRAVEDRAFT_135946 [Trametes versicolor FP-101664 SS1]EIW52138.1 hypothetical protein TRAVEDRAFT_135946 [Trametes versicolor FP-101664 SS1]
MARFSGIIRAKPNWWEKVHDAELVAKWRAEMVERDRVSVDSLWSGEGRFEYGDGEKQWPRDPLTDAQLDYIFAQLKHEADQRDPATGIYAAAVPKVYESRSLVPADLKATLIAGVSVLENVPDDKKDWHPGSNEQVLDLVHPSLYCLRIRHSYVRTTGVPAGASPVHVITEDEYNAQRPDFGKYRDTDAEYAISPLYQWLPTDFAVSEVGDVKALSYINNLHPIQHRALYPAISSILARFVPLFEKVLSDTLSPEPPLAITVDPNSWYDHVPDYSDNGEAADGEMDGWEKWDLEMKWPQVPDPEPFSPPKADGRVELKLGGRTVQVIVKLANIVLTPERPEYPGGSWHVEGMANEKIVATGLYYYASENITESRLDFRTVVGEGSDNGVWMPYEQSDDKGYNTVYGFGGGKALNQELGHIVAEEGKCIAFPNIYQHRVDDFELADRTKPGYRKILCFFLVDPLTRIMSTTDVPPQQAEWSMAEMLRVPAMQGLPVELFDMVADYATTGTMSREEAEEHRKGLMAERANFVVQHNEGVFELEFNMCEH